MTTRQTAAARVQTMHHRAKKDEYSIYVAANHDELLSRFLSGFDLNNLTEADLTTAKGIADLIHTGMQEHLNDMCALLKDRRAAERLHLDITGVADRPDAPDAEWIAWDVSCRRQAREALPHAVAAIQQAPTREALSAWALLAFDTLTAPGPDTAAPYRRQEDLRHGLTLFVEDREAQLDEL